MTLSNKSEVSRQMMEHLVDQLSTRWNAMPTRTLLPAFPELAKGKPVPIEILAKAANRDASAIRAELRNAPVEWNEHEELINVFGFKLAPTVHRLEFDGVITFACCALWSHFLPRLVGSTAKVESVDPISRRLVRLTVSPSGIESIQPAGATATLISTSAGIGANAGEDFCRHVRLFECADTASAWIAQEPKRFQADLDAVNDVAQDLCTAIWFRHDG